MVALATALGMVPVVAWLVRPSQSTIEFSKIDKTIEPWRSFGLTADEERRLYDMVSRLNAVFETFGVRYVASGGTALGAARHHGIIPWDDDVDVTVHEGDLDFVRRLFPRNKLVCEPHDVVGLKIFDEDDAKKRCCIDVFPFSLQGARTELSIERAREIWPKESFEICGMFPARPARFGPTYVMLAGNNDEYLGHIYGADWRTRGYLPPTNHFQKERPYEVVIIDPESPETYFDGVSQSHK